MNTSDIKTMTVQEAHTLFSDVGIALGINGIDVPTEREAELFGLIKPGAKFAVGSFTCGCPITQIGLDNLSWDDPEYKWSRNWAIEYDRRIPLPAETLQIV